MQSRYDDRRTSARRGSWCPGPRDRPPTADLVGAVPDKRRRSSVAGPAGCAPYKGGHWERDDAFSFERQHSHRGGSHADRLRTGDFAGRFGDSSGSRARGDDGGPFRTNSRADWSGGTYRASHQHDIVGRVRRGSKQYGRSNAGVPAHVVSSSYQRSSESEVSALFHDIFQSVPDMSPRSATEFLQVPAKLLKGPAPRDQKHVQVMTALAERIASCFRRKATPAEAAEDMLRCRVTPKDIALALWSCGRMKFFHEDLMITLANVVIGCLSHVDCENENVEPFSEERKGGEALNNGRSLASDSRNGYLRARSNHSTYSEGGALAKSPAQLNSIDISNLLWACSRLNFRHLPLLEGLLAEAVQQLRSFDSHSLAALFVALAPLDLRKTVLTPAPPPASSKIANQRIRQSPVVGLILEKLEDFDGRRLCNFLWACGKIYWRHLGVISRCCDLLMEKIPELTAQHFSNIFWTCGEFRYFHPILDELSRTLVEDAEEHSPGEESGRRKSFSGRLQDAPPRWRNDRRRGSVGGCDVARERVVGGQPGAAFSRRLDAQGLGNVFWALGRLELSRYVDLADVLAKEVVRKRRALLPQHVANIVGACGHINYINGDLCEAVAEEMCAKLDQFTAQNIANVYWGLGKIGYRCACLLPPNNPAESTDASARRLISILRQKILQFGAQSVSNMLLGCAYLNWRCEPVIEALIQRAEQLYLMASEAAKDNRSIFSAPAASDVVMSNEDGRCTVEEKRGDVLTLERGATLLEDGDKSGTGSTLASSQDTPLRFELQHISNICWALGSIQRDQHASAGDRNAICHSVVRLFAIIAEVLLHSPAIDCDDGGIGAEGCVGVAAGSENEPPLDIERKRGSTDRGRPLPRWLHSADTQHLSLVAWGFASVRVRHDDLFEMISNEVYRRLLAIFEKFRSATQSASKSSESSDFSEVHRRIATGATTSAANEIASRAETDSLPVFSANEAPIQPSLGCCSTATVGAASAATDKNVQSDTQSRAKELLEERGSNRRSLTHAGEEKNEVLGESLVVVKKEGPPLDVRRLCDQLRLYNYVPALSQLIWAFGRVFYVNWKLVCLCISLVDQDAAEVEADAKRPPSERASWFWSYSRLHNIANILWGLCVCLCSFHAEEHCHQRLTEEVALIQDGNISSDYLRHARNLGSDKPLQYEQACSTGGINVADLYRDTAAHRQALLKLCALTYRIHFRNQECAVSGSAAEGARVGLEGRLEAPKEPIQLNFVTSRKGEDSTFLLGNTNDNEQFRRKSGWKVIPREFSNLEMKLDGSDSAASSADSTNCTCQFGRANSDCSICKHNASSAAESPPGQLTEMDSRDATQLYQVTVTLLAEEEAAQRRGEPTGASDESATYVRLFRDLLKMHLRFTDVRVSETHKKVCAALKELLPPGTHIAIEHQTRQRLWCDIVITPQADAGEHLSACADLVAPPESVLKSVESKDISLATTDESVYEESNVLPTLLGHRAQEVSEWTLPVALSNRRIAIEVNGPWHYVKSISSGYLRMNFPACGPDSNSHLFGDQPAVAAGRPERNASRQEGVLSYKRRPAERRHSYLAVASGAGSKATLMSPAPCGKDHNEQHSQIRQQSSASKSDKRCRRSSVSGWSDFERQRAMDRNANGGSGSPQGRSRKRALSGDSGGLREGGTNEKLTAGGGVDNNGSMLVDEKPTYTREPYVVIMDGRTRLKRRLLTLDGWVVLGLPFYELTDKLGNQGLLIDYLKKRLTLLAESLK